MPNMPNSLSDVITIRFEGDKELITKAMPYNGQDAEIDDEQNLKNYFYDHLGRYFEMQLNITEIKILLKTSNQTTQDFTCTISVLVNKNVLFEYTASGNNHAGAIRECTREVMDNLNKLKDKHNKRQKTGLKDL